MNKKTSKEKKSKSTKSKTSMDMPSGDIRATEKVMISKEDSAHCFVMYKVGNHRLQLLTQIIR
jgi:hypothetical protein